MLNIRGRQTSASMGRVSPCVRECGCVCVRACARTKVCVYVCVRARVCLCACGRMCRPTCVFLGVCGIEVSLKPNVLLIHRRFSATRKRNKLGCAFGRDT